MALPKPSSTTVRRWAYATCVVTLLATMAGILAGYRLTADGLQARNIEFATANNQLLVDTVPSMLVDPDSNWLGSTRLALTYTLFLKTDAAREAVGQAVGVHADAVASSGPFTTLIDRTNLAVRVPQPPAPDKRLYRLVIDVAPNRPLVTLYGQAPTAREAKAIADAARSLLVHSVGSQQASFEVPEGSKVVLRPLGPTEGGVVNPGARTQFMGLIFTLVMVIGLFGFGWVGRRRKLRKLRGTWAPRPAVDPLDEEHPNADDWPHTTRVMPWLLAGFVVMLFLVPFDSISLPISLPLDSKLDRILIIPLALLWVCSIAVVTGPARPRIRLTRVHVAALAFLAVCCLSLVLNRDALISLGELQLGLKKLALLITYLLFFVIVASTVRPREVPRYVTLMIVLAVIAAVGGILEYRLKINPFYQWPAKFLPVAIPSDMFTRDSIGRISVYGPAGQPLELATILGMMLPFALLRAIETPEKRRRMLYMLAAGLMVAGAMATVRKTSFIAPGVGVAVLIAYRPRVVVRKLLPLALILGVVVHFSSPGAFGSVLSQLNPTAFNSVLTTKDRTSDYDAVRPDVMSHVLFGRGFQTYDGHKYRILDNEYLALTIGVGFVGLACYLFIFGAALTAAHPTIRGPDRRRASLALACAGAVAVMAVVTLLFDNLSFPHVPYLFFFIAALIVVLRERSPTVATAPATAPVRTGAPAARLERAPALREPAGAPAG
jgi:polysaccharide biosynthesis protein PslJ